MNYSVISGDIVSSTSLTAADREEIQDYLKDLLKVLNKRFNCFGRLIKGDYLECVVPDAGEGLRVALIIKSFVKSIPVEAKDDSNFNNRIKQFSIHGIRLAIGFGKLEKFDPKSGIIDGEAIYMSGRELSGATTYNKERIVIKNTLFFVSENEQLNITIPPVLALLDILISKATARQCEVLSLKLMGKQEDEIAKQLKIRQATVNQHSTSVGWNAIEMAVNLYKQLIPN